MDKCLEEEKHSRTRLGFRGFHTWASTATTWPLFCMTGYGFQLAKFGKGGAVQVCLVWVIRKGFIEAGARGKGQAPRGALVSWR